MKSFMEVIYGSQSGSLLAQGLQVSHQVVNVVVGVLSKQLDMSFGRRVDRVLDLAGRPGLVPSRIVGQPDGELILIARVCRRPSGRTAEVTVTVAWASRG